MNINPYQLLGLSSKSNIKDLKKAYYEFSLLCHPDRGGNGEEMDIVHKSYKYIKKQLENCKNLSYNNLEKEFENFCKIQEESTPCFSDIYDEANDFIREFNKKFSENYNNNVFNNGYGHLMEETSIGEEYTENDAEDFYKPIENNFKQEIVIYKEPFNLPNTYGEQYHLDNKKVDDFSHYGDNLSMTDYQIAFNENKNLDQIIKNDKKEQTIEELIKEREKDIELIQKSVNCYDNSDCSGDKTTLIYNLQKKKNDSAVLIQKIFRGFSIRNFYKREKYYNNLKKYLCVDQYCIIIQKNVRKYICQKSFREYLLEKEMKEIENRIQKLKNKKRSIYNINKKKFMDI